ncbi:hypothetical protein ASF46_03890 [Rathayibacter sp. Leaf296]|nr:hypothetical protein ASF46_03890 [Rathayibacter sp. Leaf296]
MPPSARLPGGRTVALEPDALRAGSLVLTIDGSEQSLIDPSDPGALDLEYTARLGAVVDALAPPRRAVRVLHLGAGALSLARYTQWTRPGSEQTVVDVEEGLVEFVVEHAPLPPGTRLRVVTADASASLPGGTVDLVVLDAYDGDEIPEGFFGAAALSRIADRVGEGLLAVNVADDADHRRLERIRAAVEPLLSVTEAVGAESFVRGRSAGNAILLASRSAVAAEVAVHLLAAGPHPVAAAAQRHVVPVEVAVEVDP